MKALDTVVLRFGQFLCRNRKIRKVRTFGNLIKALYYSYENHNYDFNKNGEKYVLNALKDFEIQTIFDVGANRGHWTKSAKQAFPKAKVYAFEIIKDTYLEFLKNTQGLEGVNSFNLGLDEKKGEVEMNFVTTLGSGNSSTYDTDFPNEAIEKRVCKVSTIDNMMEELGIKHIDFLKIDVEGMEPRVLKGAIEALKQKRIKAIQFEYGMVSVETHFLLKDYYDFFENVGYKVGKIYPSYIDFTPYHRTKENFIGPNFLAVKKDDLQLMELLG